MAYPLSQALTIVLFRGDVSVISLVWNLFCAIDFHGIKILRRLACVKVFAIDKIAEHPAGGTQFVQRRRQLEFAFLADVVCDLTTKYFK